MGQKEDALRQHFSCMMEMFHFVSHVETNIKFLN